MYTDVKPLAHSCFIWRSAAGVSICEGKFQIQIPCSCVFFTMGVVMGVVITIGVEVGSGTGDGTCIPGKKGSMTGVVEVEVVATGGIMHGAVGAGIGEALAVVVASGNSGTSPDGSGFTAGGIVLVPCIATIDCTHAS